MPRQNPQLGKLGGRFRYFCFFLPRGKGKGGGARAGGRGEVGFYCKSIVGGGGVIRGGVGGGAHAPGGCLQEGRAKYFFRGRSSHQLRKSLASPPNSIDKKLALSVQETIS